MKCAPFIVCLFMAAMSTHAQVQEQKMQERLLNPNMNKTADLQGKSFNSSSFNAKTFATGAFGGTKSASIKTYETRSFLGVKNPWFGKKVFGTYASRATEKSASEADKQFQTEAFAVREYDKSARKDIVDAGTVVSADTQPRPYLVTPKAQGGVSRFTENLHKDLTIDDVRDLLNKGKGE